MYVKFKYHLGASDSAGKKRQRRRGRGVGRSDELMILRNLCRYLCYVCDEQGEAIQIREC